MGNHRPLAVRELLAGIEDMLGKTAIIELEPMQPDDVTAQFLRPDRLAVAVDLAPRISIDEGLRPFLDRLLWYGKQ